MVSFRSISVTGDLLCFKMSNETINLSTITEIEAAAEVHSMFNSPG